MHGKYVDGNNPCIIFELLCDATVFPSNEILKRFEAHRRKGATITPTLMPKYVDSPLPRGIFVETLKRAMYASSWSS
jgi:hypothetical protein